MLMREASPELHPGAYLIAVGPAAATLPYDALRRSLRRALAGLGRAS